MRRTGWRFVNGRWARSLGERGVRVRLFQKRKGGVFYRFVWVPGVGPDRKSLGTADRDEADRLGARLLGGLLAQDRTEAQGAVLLGDLWARYHTEALTFLDNAASTRRDDEARAEILLAFFGDACHVRTLTVTDVQRYATVRRAGGIRVTSKNGEYRITKAVRSRAVACDLKLLKAMLRWATTVRTRRGAGRLLEQNPLDGFTLEREKNPRRPVATWERFEKTRAAIAELRDDPALRENGEEEAKAAAQARHAANRLRWIKLDLALVLVEGTGRRVGSVRQLQWPDFDLTRGRIRWRAEADKKRRDSTVPVTSALVEEVKRARSMIAELAGLQALQGFVFFAETDSSRPVDRDTLNRWLETAEKHARLDALEGGLWHPYRRKWATERKHHPLKDVAEAGGWKDVNTLLTCYTAADEETMLAVMSERRKVREVSAAES